MKELYIGWCEGLQEHTVAYIARTRVTAKAVLHIVNDTAMVGATGWMLYYAGRRWYFSKELTRKEFLDWWKWVRIF